MSRLAAAGHGVGGGAVLIAALLILTLGVAFGLKWRRLVDFGGDDARGARDVGAAGRRGSPSSLVAIDDGEDAADSGYVGHAILAPVGAAATRGSVTFAVMAGALRIRAIVENAPPGEDALSLKADPACLPPERAVAGHPEPRDPGAGPRAATRGLADLGRLEVGADGRGELLLYLHPSAYRHERSAGWRQIVGKTVVLGGPGGEPVACGVVVRQGGGPHH